MKKALIVWGGWPGHDPETIANRFKKILENDSFEVELSNELSSYEDAEKLKTLDLIVPYFTGGEITWEQVCGVRAAVSSGVGLAGPHCGLADCFRTSVEWQMMTGVQWIAVPGADKVEYTVNIRKNASSPIVFGIDDFQVTSEQYYVHIDPSINVLATTRFPIADGDHAANGFFDMPVVFTKLWGKGRVFYNSLGHSDDMYDKYPAMAEITRRGFLWAAEGKAIAAASAK